MATNRKLPFGYEIREGAVVLRPNEAEMVRWIYQQYIAGLSYETLTQKLCQQPVPYLPGKAWNKNMVARILADNRYLGAAQFPQVIEPQLYQTVRERIPSKISAKKKSKTAGTIQRLAVCGICGARVVREPCSHGKERWQCPTCKAITTKATDQRLKSGVEWVVKYLIRFPRMVVRETENNSDNESLNPEKETAFRELLDTPNFDEVLANQMALDLAMARFDILDSVGYESRRIQYVLEQIDTEKEFNTDLIQKIADAVLIQPDGKVSLQLKNGQIIDEE